MGWLMFDMFAYLTPAELLNWPWVVVFVPFGVWWWLLITADLVIVGCVAENDDFFGWFGAFVLAAGLVVLSALGDTGVLTWAVDHPWHIIIGFICYLVCGVLWGIFKWEFVFIPAARRDYEEFKRIFLRQRGTPIVETDGSAVIPEAAKGDFYSTLRNSWYYNRAYNQIQIQPLARQNKARLSRWMAYWVWSLLRYMWADFLQHLYDRIITALSRFLDSLAARHFAGTGSDYEKPSASLGRTGEPNEENRPI